MGKSIPVLSRCIASFLFRDGITTMIAHHPVSQVKIPGRDIPRSGVLLSAISFTVVGLLVKS
ncbi:MAG: hypothetical protein ACLSB9_20665 [Hydrogeniiclostridium mannosilyticum]